MPTVIAARESMSTTDRDREPQDEASQSRATGAAGQMMANDESSSRVWRPSHAARP
jgi:hypothetical protein